MLRLRITGSVFSVPGCFQLKRFGQVERGFVERQIVGCCPEVEHVTGLAALWMKAPIDVLGNIHREAAAMLSLSTMKRAWTLIVPHKSCFIVSLAVLAALLSTLPGVELVRMISELVIFEGLL